MNWSWSDVERSFYDALCAAGITPESGERLFLDGKKHRFRIKGDKHGEKSGEYCVFTDEHPAGWFKSYKLSHNCEYQTWCFGKDSEFAAMSFSEREAWLAERERAKAAREDEAKLQRLRAADLAKRKWEAATKFGCPLHPYMLKKGLHSCPAAKQFGNDIILPFRDASGEVMTVQTVSSDGEKKFQFGGQKRGCFCVISDEVDERGLCRLPASGTVFVGEGWATCVSVHEATGCAVVAAADCGNLAPVVEALRSLCAGCEIVVAADNDGGTGKGNAGVFAAIRIFEEFGCAYVFPRFTPEEEARRLTDWNDFAAARGVEAAGAAIWQQVEAMRGSQRFAEKNAWPRWVDLYPPKNNSSLPKPMSTVSNFKVLLRFLGVNVWYDEVIKDARALIPDVGFASDTRASAERSWLLSQMVKYGLPKAELDDYFAFVANENVRNPVREWILSRPWDGRKRIDEVIGCVKCRSCIDYSWQSVLMKKWFLSAVAAVFLSEVGGRDRRFHAEGALIFQGEQGIGKTSFFSALVPDPEWFGNGLTIDPVDKDSVRRAVSCWIVEMGEIEGTFKKVELSRLKSFLTNDCDRFRVPYGRRDDAYARRTVFCGSVNQAEFLMDDTGTRRFWCLPVEYIDLTRLRAVDMQQFWAEVRCEFLKVYDQPCAWWLTAEEQERLASANWRFEAPDKVEDLIVAKLEWESPRGFWTERTATEILIECGVMNPQKGDAMKASRVLRKMTGAEARHNGRARVFSAPPVKHLSVY